MAVGNLVYDATRMHSALRSRRLNANSNCFKDCTRLHFRAARNPPIQVDAGRSTRERRHALTNLNLCQVPYFNGTYSTGPKVRSRAGLSWRGPGPGTHDSATSQGKPGEPIRACA